MLNGSGGWHAQARPYMHPRVEAAVLAQERLEWEEVGEWWGRDKTLQSLFKQFASQRKTLFKQ